MARNTDKTKQPDTEGKQSGKPSGSRTTRPSKTKHGKADRDAAESERSGDAQATALATILSGLSEVLGRPMMPIMERDYGGHDPRARALRAAGGLYADAAEGGLAQRTGMPGVSAPDGTELASGQDVAARYGRDMISGGDNPGRLAMLLDMIQNAPDNPAGRAEASNRADRAEDIALQALRARSNAELPSERPNIGDVMPDQRGWIPPHRREANRQAPVNPLAAIVAGLQQAETANERRISPEEQLRALTVGQTGGSPGRRNRR